MTYHVKEASMVRGVDKGLNMDVRCRVLDHLNDSLRTLENVHVHAERRVNDALHDVEDYYFLEATTGSTKISCEWNFEAPSDADELVAREETVGGNAWPPRTRWLPFNSLIMTFS